MDYEATHVEVAAQLAEAARQQALALKNQLAEALGVQKAWEDLAKFIQLGWHAHILHLLEAEGNRLKDARLANEVLFEQVHRIAREKAAEAQRRFPALLESACREAGLQLDADRPHPRYGFNRHFLTLVIDDQRRMAKLSDNEGTLAELPSDVGAVVNRVRQESARLFQRRFDGKKFWKDLRKQYLAILSKTKQPDGSSVPIRHITRRSRKNVRDFCIDEFVIDLSRLVEQGPVEIDGVRIDLQQTKDTREGMLLHGAAGRGYVGFIVFNRSGNGQASSRDPGN